MCGIFGYIGPNNCLSFLIEGLKKLEYRGYDSAGIGILNENGLVVEKEKGKIDQLSSLPGLKDLEGSIGIAHTRWATHGEPNQVNAHPHTSNDEKIAIVHNGIIENYNAIRKVLKESGSVFKSNTDSEVLAHLIEQFYTDNLEDAVLKALKSVEGTFGLAVIHENEEKIVAVRRGSPLIIGLGSNNEIFLSSDAVSILEHTKKVIYLNDNEMAVLTRSGYEITKLNGQKVDKKVHEIRWNIEQIEKKGYKHFMLKEIFEQPSAFQNVLRGRIKDGKIKLSINIDPDKIERIILTACGTSYYSALIGKYFIEKTVGIPVVVDYASEFRYSDTVIHETDLILAISQSGETADTLAAIRKGKSMNANTLGIVNTVGSTIAREVDSGIYLHAGPEIGVASTKAFVCQVAALYLVGLYLQQQKGIEPNPKLIEEFSTLHRKIDQTLELNSAIRKIAELTNHNRNFLYLGRNFNYPVAMEGALKLKEISYIHAEGYPAAEMKHGPIALIDKDMPVVFLATRCSILDKVISNMEEVKSRNGVVIALTDHENEHIERLSHLVIRVPETMEILSPLLNVIPLQLLAYHIADIKGLNVDRPRNLAKSVTVE